VWQTRSTIEALSMNNRLVALAVAAGLAMLTGATWAASSDFAQMPAKNRQTHKYTCATGRILQVTYWNTSNGQSFALVPVKGRQLLFVNTMSGSGAKYQAGSYTWWTKGPRADLYDAMNGENAPPMLSDCITINR
jgi:membrane-bound inhibitor of C-type lysozyme